MASMLRSLSKETLTGFFIREGTHTWWEPNFKFPFYHWVFQDQKYKHGTGICMTLTYAPRGK